MSIYPKLHSEVIPPLAAQDIAAVLLKLSEVRFDELDLRDFVVSNGSWMMTSEVLVDGRPFLVAISIQEVK